MGLHGAPHTMLCDGLRRMNSRRLTADQLLDRQRIHTRSFWTLFVCRRAHHLEKHVQILIAWGVAPLAQTTLVQPLARQ